MSNNKIIPCTGCEEVCGKITHNLRVYMGVMDWNRTKSDMWAFWRTLSSFIVHKDDIAVLGAMYDNFMSDSNKEKVSKTNFILHMTRSPL